jgi:ATP-dependent Lon protease
VEILPERKICSADSDSTLSLIEGVILLTSRKRRIHLMPQASNSSLEIQLPSELPLIVLSECFHFPGCFLPLCVFEQKYRDMLKLALETHRMFGVGVRVQDDSDDILPMVTVGLIRACVTQQDGTSNVMLQGVKRMSITGYTQTEPFKIASITALRCKEACPDRVAELQQLAIESLPRCPVGAEAAMAKLMSQLKDCQCPEAVCDLLTYHFIRSGDTLAKSMTEASLVKRYELLIGALGRFKSPV